MREPREKKELVVSGVSPSNKREPTTKRVRKKRRSPYQSKAKKFSSKRGERVGLLAVSGPRPGGKKRKIA